MSLAHAGISHVRFADIGDRAPNSAKVKFGWRWVITRAVRRAGGRAQLRGLLGIESEETLRRWINNMDAPSPSHNDERAMIASAFTRDPEQAIALLDDIRMSLSDGRGEPATPGEIAARIKHYTDILKEMTLTDIN